MYLNKRQARHQDQSINGKYNNFSPTTTTRHRPPESRNSKNYDKSTRVGLFLNKTNKTSYNLPGGLGPSKAVCGHSGAVRVTTGEYEHFY